MADVPPPPPRDAVDRAWPAPWGPAQPGAVRVATQERVPLEAITGSVQGEVERGRVDAYRTQIERALQGQGRLPPVTFVQDPRVPGGLVTLDGNHTLQAYRELGFREVPGQVYNADGTRARVEKAQFHPDRVFPADADEAFRRAQRTGGSQAGGVVYGVGGTPENPQVYKFSPDGRYLGTAPPHRRRRARSAPARGAEQAHDARRGSRARAAGRRQRHGPSHRRRGPQQTGSTARSSTWPPTNASTAALGATRPSRVRPRAAERGPDEARTARGRSVLGPAYSSLPAHDLPTWQMTELSRRPRRAPWIVRGPRSGQRFRPEPPVSRRRSG